ncbi:MAG: hypothetical protein QNJ55_27700 [Xenococcus sp. MO_188.B8]|nr:hypothetical protein [Xenococcus sp. MO_188.B8]
MPNPYLNCMCRKHYLIWYQIKNAIAEIEIAIAYSGLKSVKLV